MKKELNLSIVIPTIKYSSYLDEAIESVLELNEKVEIIVSINATSKIDFQKSRYYNYSEVNWKFTEKFLPPTDSINFAIRSSTKNWIYILCDDDILLKNFLPNEDFDNLDERKLIGIKLCAIDDKSKEIYCEKPLPHPIFNSEQAIKALFNHQLRSHIGLFIFSRRLYNEVDGLIDLGFENGYYVDTLFQFRIFSKAHSISFADGIQMGRRLHIGQASAKIYYNYSEVKKNFLNLIEEIKKDKHLYLVLLKETKSEKNLLNSFIIKRFWIDFGKLESPHWNNRLFSKKLIHLLKFILKSEITWLKKIETIFKTIYRLSIYIAKYAIVKCLEISKIKYK